MLGVYRLSISDQNFRAHVTYVTEIGGKRGTVSPTLKLLIEDLANCLKAPSGPEKPGAALPSRLGKGSQ